MNRFRATTREIRIRSLLSLITVGVQDRQFVTAIIDTSEIVLLRKISQSVESELLTGKELLVLSQQNAILGAISELTDGEILSKVTVETCLGKVIVQVERSAITRFALKKNDSAFALVRTNEMVLHYD
ncbi:MAG: hypothetical protein AAF519_19050 [Bacteroidota bacterium]